MELFSDLTQYILILVTGFIVGFINTIAGSGSLLSLPLLIWVGLDPLTANGTNRIAIWLQSLTGVAIFFKERQYKLRRDMWFIIPSILGSIPGALIAVDLEQETMQRVIGVVMLFMLAVMIINPVKAAKQTKIRFKSRDLIIAGIFFLIGLYGGFIQAGVGIFILAAFSISREMDLLRANAVKLLITFLFTSAVIPVFILHGQVDFLYGLLLGVGSMAGAVISAKVAIKRGTPFLKYFLYLVILAIAIYFFVR